MRSTNGFCGGIIYLRAISSLSDEAGALMGQKFTFRIRQHSLLCHSPYCSPHLFIKIYSMLFDLSVNKVHLMGLRMHTLT